MAGEPADCGGRPSPPQSPRRGGPGERRSDTLILRGLQVVSHQLGLSGQCDVVEFHATPKGVPLQGMRVFGSRIPWSINGESPNPIRRMNCSCAPRPCAWRRCSAALFQKALCSMGSHAAARWCSSPPELRETVRRDSDEMHQLYHRGHTPKAKPSKSCSACSLKELCLPQLVRRESVQTYLRRAMEESP